MQRALHSHVKALGGHELVQVLDAKAQTGPRDVDEHRREHAGGIAQHAELTRVRRPSGSAERLGFGRVGHQEMVQQVDDSDADILEQPVGQRGAFRDTRQALGEHLAHQGGGRRLGDPVTIGVWWTGGHGHPGLRWTRRARGSRPARLFTLT